MKKIVSKAFYLVIGVLVAFLASFSLANSSVKASGLDEYYIAGSFNNYELQEEYKLKPNAKETAFKEYTIIISNKNDSQFYITNGETEYRNGNDNILLEEKTNYQIYFSPEHLYENQSNIRVEKVKYYILCDANNWTEAKNYQLLKNNDNGLFNEYVYSIDVKDTFQFQISAGNEIIKDGKGNFFIMNPGRYNIYYSPEHQYENRKNVIIREDKIPVGRYYVSGSFNNYEINPDYELKYDSEETEFTQYTLITELKNGDSFYVTDGETKWYTPESEELKISYDGTYKIFFSKDYDYGNGYNIYFKLERSPETEARTLEITNSEEFIDFVNKCTNDVFSTNLTVEITKNIDLKGKTIPSIGIFAGILNGNFHIISNFKIQNVADTKEFGFIRQLTVGAEVNNLTIQYDFNTDNKNMSVGGIVGTNFGTINNSCYKGVIKGTNIVGGIAAANESGALIIKAANYSEVIGNSFVGGITGINNGEIRESVNYGKINRTPFSSSTENKVLNIGGIAGYNGKRILSCINKGAIGYEQTGDFVGGIAGNSIGVIESSYNEGKIIGKRYIGGIVGQYADLKSSAGENQEYDDIIKFIEDILKGHSDSLPDVEIPKPSKDNASSLKYCYNKASVNGEFGVGGIAGYASNEKKPGSSKKENYNILVCFNTGNITSKGGYAGGIVGRHVLGEISDCFNTGIIKSEKKDYVGGIAGSSTGTISSCFAICTIDGKNYVGGIAGYGEGLNNNYSIVNFYNTEKMVGAISGNVKEVNEKIFNNYYVKTGKLLAIDGLDYQGKAEEVNRELLASKGMLNISLDFKSFVAGEGEKAYPILRKMLEENEANQLSSDFKAAILKVTSYSCTITFVDGDDEIVRIDRVEYGKDYDLNNLPDLINKEGKFAEWDKSFTGKNITSDQIVHIVYKDIIPSIASDDTSNPQIIVEGSFYSDTRVEISKTDNNYQTENALYKSLGTYRVNIIDTDNKVDKSNIIAKFRLPEGSTDIIIGIVKDGKLIYVESSIDGDYVRFELAGADEFMVLEKEYFNPNNPDFIRMITIVSISVGAVVIGLTTAIVVLVLKKKNSKPASDALEEAKAKKNKNNELDTKNKKPNSKKKKNK